MSRSLAIVPVLAILTVLAIGFTAESGAATWCVEPGNPGCAPTIQAGIDSAANGDTVRVVDGVYTGTGNRDLDFAGKDIVVMSDSDVPDLCLIDCQATAIDEHRGFYFDDGEPATAVVQGFTIRNGYTLGYGGGIYFTGSTPTIRNCIIDSCRADGSLGGGALYTNSCSPTIENCRIIDNTATTGGGIRCNDAGSTPIIRGCVFSGNQAVTSAGGISCADDAIPVIEKCEISGNTAGTDGGGISIGRDEIREIKGCTIVGNHAGTYGGGIYVKYQTSTVDLDSSIIWDNTADGDGDEVYVHKIGSEEGTAYFDCCLIDSAGVRGDGVVNWGTSNYFTDPLFCGTLNENPYTLSGCSPATRENSGGCGLIGAYDIGCRQGPDLYVPGEFATIQDAINCATYGDNVIVAAGTYYEYDIVMKDGVSLIGAESSNTIIDAENLGRVIYCENLGSSTLIQGFTITNGLATGSHPDDYGAGIYCNACSLTVADCVLSNNTATDGGGMWAGYSSPTIANCTFMGNDAGDDGGGAAVSFSSATFTACVFDSNHSINEGGGIYSLNESSVTLDSCTFSSNTAATFGGGASLFGGSAMVSHCDLYGNYATNDAGGLKLVSLEGVVHHCSIYENEAGRDGGGLWLSVCDSGVVSNCIITDNTAGRHGGGIIDSYNVPITYSYCLIAENHAGDDGGAMRNINSSVAEFTHCTIACNDTPQRGAGIELYDGSQITLSNCILAFNTGAEAVHCDQGDEDVSATLNCCDVYGNEGGDYVDCIDEQYGVDGNISEDPLFCDGCNGNYYLAGCSPCLRQPCGLMGAYGRGCFCEAPYILDISDVGNDQGRRVRITWERSIYDAAGDAIDITGYGVYRRQDQYLRMPEGTIKSTEEKPAIVGMLMLAGWDYVDRVDARGDSVYQFVAPTLCDSTIDGICRSTFFISAITPDPLVYFDSYPDSGYSIDNLAPSVPLGLGGEELIDSLRVFWDPNPEEDVQYYKVYRGRIPDFDIGDAEGIYESADTFRLISDVDPCSLYYYRVSAVDFAGNEGGPSPSVPLCAAASVPETGEIFRFALIGGRPNPFTNATAIAFSIPVRQQVSLAMYDVSGRLVTQLVDEAMEAGRHQAEWDGMNNSGNEIPAGIYFSRLESGGKRATEKVILVR